MKWRRKPQPNPTPTIQLTDGDTVHTPNGDRYAVVRIPDSTEGLTLEGPMYYEPPGHMRAHAARAFAMYAAWQMAGFDEETARDLLFQQIEIEGNRE